MAQPYPLPFVRPFPFHHITQSFPKAATSDSFGVASVHGRRSFHAAVRAASCVTAPPWRATWSRTCVPRPGHYALAAIIL
ncbi:hypothetical protein EVAR_27492_1 [Eumeta japonica]|uniref:Uncharacterized protein n=1 Tax=Eumeta variegata TaxID=151549 RepID=A0A4C1XHC8_EUMVA|nr:hypothetical protein EVAR_27492_1 [Eumeta japonica]